MTRVLASSALAGALAIANVASAAAPEREHYVLHCSGCHGPTGAGSSAVPSLDALPRLVATPGGRRYLVRIPGVAHAPVSDAELAALLNWLVREHTGSPPEPPFSALEVGPLRADPLLDPTAARARLLAE